VALTLAPVAVSPRHASFGDALWGLRRLADVLAILISVGALAHPQLGNWIYAALVLLILRLGDTYRRRIVLSVLDHLPRLLMPSAVGLLVIGVARPFVTLDDAYFSQAILVGVAIVLGRVWSYSAIRVARTTGRMAEPTLIIGAGTVGVELFRVLHQHREYGLLPVGVLDDVAHEPTLRPLGGIADFEQVVNDHGVRRVIVAFGPGAEHDMVKTLRGAAHLEVEVHVVPRFFELGLAPTGPTVEHVWGIPLYRLRPSAMRATAWRTKRALDIVVASVALALLAPVLGVLALCVRFTSPGPILFRQRRIGQHGAPIDVLKFRTLSVNDDSDLTWSVSDDPRQTSIGRWLRRLSLDELPQLWNVLRGDMTLIGPRPERPHFVEQYSNGVPGYGDRHRLPVGLTGMSQVHGLRGNTSIAERARFDNLYIEHWSGWQDTKILLQTIIAVVRDGLRAGDGAAESAWADSEEVRVSEALAGIAAASDSVTKAHDEVNDCVPGQLSFT
jgi:exopolysaccharide biosynthesis polyprenyl glycosylphosphotransferase